MWLLKATGFNRGIGIHVFSTLNELLTLLKEYAQTQGLYVSSHMVKCYHTLKKLINSTTAEDVSEVEASKPKEQKENKTVKSCSFVIQKYLESPLLIDRRKFDVRVWVLLTHDQKLYMFKEPYVRTSSEHFSLNP